MNLFALISSSRQDLKFRRVFRVACGLVIAAGIMVACLGLPGRPNHENGAVARPIRRLMGDEFDRVSGERQAGLKHDLSHEDVILRSLRGDGHPDEVGAALTSAARLGDMAALPAIDRLVNGGRYDIQARVARARIVAEHTLSAQSGPESAGGVIREFEAQLGLSADEINAGVATYDKKPDGRPRETPIEVYAMRSIADIVYHDTSNSLLTTPEVKALNFTADYPSSLKIQLSPLSSAARLKWLIDDLASSRIASSAKRYEVVLASDLGRVAGDAVAAKLVDMDAHRASYTRIGYLEMFDVIRAAGDPTHSNLWPRYAQDSDPGIRYYVKGRPPIIIPAY